MVIPAAMTTATIARFMLPASLSASQCHPLWHRHAQSTTTASRNTQGRVLDLVEAGRRVAEVAQDLGISEQTSYNWRRQDRIDRGLEAGLSTAGRSELRAARKRIRELEAELAVHRRATELLKENADPKDGSRPSR